jgi:DDE superfamily endonuclease
MEVNEGNINEINPTVAKNIGLDIFERNNGYKVSYSKSIPKMKDGKECEIKDNRTVVRLCDLNNKNVKTTTGFPTVFSMLSFIVVLTDGKIAEIERKFSKLTWLEEWLILFEVLWSKSCGRWVDLEAKYNVSPRCLRRIFDNKLKTHVRCREKWPRYAIHNEDLLLRKSKWNEWYSEKRLIMWDNTNVPIKKPSSPDAQRNTYSKYYAGNVAKGGVFIQPCGWMGTHDLWAGAVTDSEYMERSGIIQQQHQYIIDNDETTKHIPWNIILDKGYRINTVSWVGGKQLVLQPTFAMYEIRFTSLETIRSAAIASDRSANERAVRYMKNSDYIRKGLQTHESAYRLNNVWNTWGFQINFLYKPVL